MPTVSQLKQAKSFVMGMSGEIKFPVLGGLLGVLSETNSCVFCNSFLFTICSDISPLRFL